jgi:hypothetical protein
MLVCESMEACISVCMCAKSSIRRSSHLIPSTMRSAWSTPITGIPGRGRGFGSEARHGVTLRGVITTTLMVTRVATPIPSVPLGLLRVSLRCSRGLLCCLHASSPVSARWSYEVVARLSHQIKLQCKTFTRVQSKVWVR